MSSDFSAIQAAMAFTPDIDIDPNSGTTMRASGKTLGQKYQMEDKVSPKMAEKIRERALLNEDGKEASKSQVDAYKEMMGIPTSTQVKEYQRQLLEAQQNAQAEALAKVQMPTMPTGKTSPVDTDIDTDIEHLQTFMENQDAVPNAPVLNEQVVHDDNMMDAYVNSINKKLKWSKK